MRSPAWISNTNKIIGSWVFEIYMRCYIIQCWQRCDLCNNRRHQLRIHKNSPWTFFLITKNSFRRISMLVDTVMPPYSRLLLKECWNFLVTKFYKHRPHPGKFLHHSNNSMQSNLNFYLYLLCVNEQFIFIPSLFPSEP